MSKPRLPRANRLTLSGAVNLLLDNFSGTAADARSALELQLDSGGLSLAVVMSLEGAKTDYGWRDRREIRWDNDTFLVEASWGTSPPELIEVVPLIERSALLRSFNPGGEGAGSSKGGRPVQHDWDRFWIEIARIAARGEVPATRDELSRRMSDWFAVQSEVPPDLRTIEHKISLFYKEFTKE